MHIFKLSFDVDILTCIQGDSLKGDKDFKALPMLKITQKCAVKL